MIESEDCRDGRDERKLIASLITLHHDKLENIASASASARLLRHPPQVLAYPVMNPCTLPLHAQVMLS
jgi:hypothetical protein